MMENDEKLKLEPPRGTVENSTTKQRSGKEKETYDYILYKLIYINILWVPYIRKREKGRTWPGPGPGAWAPGPGVPVYNIIPYHHPFHLPSLD